MTECANCGKTRDQLVRETGLAFDIVGVHESQEWQVCNVKCLKEWVLKEVAK